MEKFQKISLFLLRVALGLLFFYSGISKVLNPEWSAYGFLVNASTFQGLYAWFAQPEILPVIDFVNQWALLLLGVSLVFGVFVRWSSFLGIFLMLLYYFPNMSFPFVGEHAFIVDEHIVYILVLVVFIAFKVGRIWGLDGFIFKKGKS